jgi:phosphohistidine phosphatase
MGNLMDVYFFRHGDAEPGAGVGSDEARPLTERGRQETRAVAEALLRAGVQPDAIFTSPLVRARQTADILQEVFGVAAQVEERLRCGCTLEQVQELVGEQSHERIMLVGHEPDFGRMVGQLIGGGRVEMKKSGVARVEVERVEAGTGVLVWLLSPGVLPT